MKMKFVKEKSEGTNGGCKKVMRGRLIGDFEPLTNAWSAPAKNAI
jgi:hypothetical protein